MEGCVRSWDKIRMVHWSMGDGSRVVRRIVYKESVLALEDFLFFSLYSFSCIASNSTTLENILILVPRYALRVQPCNIHITCARPRPLQRGCLIPIINTKFIDLSTTAYLRILFLSSSYPKTLPLAPEQQERPICNGAKDRLLDKSIRRCYAV